MTCNTALEPKYILWLQVNFAHPTHPVHMLHFTIAHTNLQIASETTDDKGHYTVISVTYWYVCDMVLQAREEKKNLIYTCTHVSEKQSN